MPRKKGSKTQKMKVTRHKSKVTKTTRIAPTNVRRQAIQPISSQTTSTRTNGPQIISVTPL